MTLKATLAGTEAQAILIVQASGTPPTVRLTAPPNGATFTAPATLTLTAEATASTGATVVRVEFFAGNRKVAEASGTGAASGTFTAAWNTVPEGVYRLTARVTDSFGLQAVSAPAVTVTVNPAGSGPVVPAPQISPPGGTYEGFVSVSITDSLPGATIYYTVDGSDPAAGSAGSVVYGGGPFLLEQSATVKARAVKSGYTPSAVASEDYVITSGGGGGNGTGLTALITAPTDGATLTQPTPVVGTITAGSATGAAWEIDYRLCGEVRWTTLQTGGVPTGTTTVSARFDPTLLLNGAYELRLVALDREGNRAENAVSVVVEGNLKVGNFRLSYTDLVVPVAGIPLTVNRVYDTLDKRTSTPDGFGTGWTLNLANVRLQKSVPLHEDWEESNPKPTDLLRQFVVRPTRSHFVTITFPNGQVYRFAAVLTPTRQYIEPVRNARVEYVPVGQTRGTLVSNDDVPAPDNFVFVVNSQGNNPGVAWEPVYLMSYTNLVYNPTRFFLTTTDGTVWELDEKLGLVAVTETNGNTVTVGPDGFHSSRGMSVVFGRDGAHRISSITDPNGRVLHYQIDGNGDLSAFTDRENKTVHFDYDDRHNLTRLIDALGVPVLGNVFNEQGRLVQTRDADNNTTTFIHGIDDPVAPVNVEVTKDALGTKIVMAYDKRGNVLSTTRFLANPDGTQKPITTTTSYDDLSNPDSPTALTDAEGNSTTFTYGIKGELLTITNALGITTSTRTYDSVGDLLP